MTSGSDSFEHRHLLATARRYRREGYRVSMPGRGDSFPAFLEGWAPDLVAERDDDRVVIEIKRATAVPGSNDLVALAEAIARQPDWRFELISLAGNRAIVRPDIAAGSNEMRRLSDMGFMKAAFIVGCALIENLVSVAALENGLNPVHVPFSKVVRELVVLGIISSDMREAITEMASTRNTLFHQGNDPTRGEVDRLSSLARRIMDEMAEVEAA